MKLDRYNRLRNDLETFSFEKNFFNLSKTLYYFSFLGNIFLVLFSYFFIKNITDSIPKLFPGQDFFFSVFIILFMSSYELFKRFAFERLTSTFLRIRKLTFNTFIGAVVCIGLVAGSFYLSLNGAHRLIDTSPSLANKLDTVQNRAADSISSVYKPRIDIKEQQILAIQQNDENGVLNARQRNTVRQLEVDVKSLEQERDIRIKQFEDKTDVKLSKQETEISKNNFAFAAMVFFLEFIILIGVAFSAFYEWTSYTEMKSVLLTPAYRQIELNQKLLRLYYQNGRKKESDSVISMSKLRALASNTKLECTLKDITEFITVCAELEIITGSKKKRVYNMPYEKAITLFEKQGAF